MAQNPTMPHSSDQLYWSRPDPAHFRALNLAAVFLNKDKQASLAILSSSFFAVETIKRTPYPIKIVGTGVFDSSLFADHMRRWAWGEIEPVQLNELKGTFSAMLWAEPQKRDSRQVLGVLDQIAARGCSLDVIIGSGGIRIAARKISDGLKDREGTTPQQVIKLLRRFRWQVDTIVPYYGPRYTFWRGLSNLFLKTGRLNWSDRCIQTLNSRMREPAWLWRLASLVMIRARKT
jgi:hypothetical protein